MLKRDRFDFAVHIMLFFSLLGFLVSASAQPNLAAWEAFKDSCQDQNMDIVWDDNTYLPKRIWNMLTKFPVVPSFADSDTIIFSFKQFIHKHNYLFGIDTSQLRLRSLYKIRDRWFVQFGQYYQNIEVHQVNVGGIITDSAEIVSYSSSYLPGISIQVQTQLDIDSAAVVARNSYRPPERTGLIAKNAYLILYPERQSGTILLGWKFLMQAALPNPRVDKYFIVDANNGDILKQYPAYVQDIAGSVHAWIFPVNPPPFQPQNPTDVLNRVPVAHEYVNVDGLVDTTDLQGSYAFGNLPSRNVQVNFKIEGPFAKVQEYDVTSTASNIMGKDIERVLDYSALGLYSFTWGGVFSNNMMGETDAMNVFYHLNVLHDNFYSDFLDFAWMNIGEGDPEQCAAVVNYDQNGSWAGYPLLFGNISQVRCSDVIYHEANHNVMYKIFGDCWIGYDEGYETEGAAMDEGFSDYFASAFTDDPAHGEGYGGTRNCDNTLTYAVPYTEGAHDGGQIFAGALWDLRSDYEISKEYIDKLCFSAMNHMALEPRPYYFSNDSESNFLIWLLYADDNDFDLANGTPNDCEIFQSFRNHHLLPVDVFCRDNEEDGGNVPLIGAQGKSPDIWVRNQKDGVTTHQDPLFGQDNYIYVRVSNIGYQDAEAVKVMVYWADQAGDIAWPSDWHFIGDAYIASIAAGGMRVASPIKWKPEIQSPPICLIGSQSVIVNPSLLVRLECGADRMTEDGNISMENNIAQLNIDLLDSSEE